MRCHSVQTLWSSTPPTHHVVAIVATKNPPALWTGGSRGDIVYWKFPSRPPDDHSENDQDFWPMALLCGHTAAIVDLVVCRLDEARENESLGNTAAEMDDSFSVTHDFSEIIVSVCVEGWLCAWDNLTGRCRRRRKLPPWIGSPCIVKTLNGAARYLAIACDGSVSGNHTNSSNNEGDNELRRMVFERSGSMKKDTKGAVVIVDSFSLGVLQVVHHGFIDIGPIKALITLPDDDLRHKLMVSDAIGHVREWNFVLDKNMKGENGGEQLRKDMSPRCKNKADFGSGVQSLSFSNDGAYMLLVFITRWVLILTEDQNVVEESERVIDTPELKWVGGFFLSKIGDPSNSSNRDTAFLVWDAHGAADVYCLRNSTEKAFQIPPFGMPKDPELQVTIRYHQSDSILVRVVCCDCIPDSDTLVSLWVIPENLTNLVDFRDYMKHQVSTISCSKASLRKWWSNFNIDHSVMDASSQNGISRESFHTPFNPLVESSVLGCISSSMVLFNKSGIPCAFILGLNSGDIRVLFFRTMAQDRSRNGISDHVKHLNKHTGPVICLAEHSTFEVASDVNTRKSGKRFLISGGLDCLTCIWDLDPPNELVVALHHHVTPVHQIILPPLGTYAPWSNCFLSVGEDGSIALVSLETMQVERMFVGHPTRPKMIAWDGIRGYLSCLCSNISTSFMGSDVLFMWDMKSGALERVLRGAAAHSMYDHFVKQIHGSSVANALFDMQATSISSLLHVDIDSPRMTTAQRCGITQFSGLNCLANVDNDASPRSISVNKGDENEDPQTNSNDVQSNKMVGGFEKISAKLSQALNQGTKASGTQADNGTRAMPRTSNRSLFHTQPPIKGASPLPGVVALQFDLFTLMTPDLGRLGKTEREEVQTNKQDLKYLPGNKSNGDSNSSGGPDVDSGSTLSTINAELANSLGSSEGCLLRTSLAFLHLWGADLELDECLRKDLQIVQPETVWTAAGFAGDRGATTLLLPGWRPTFEMWTTSSEFCALRSLTIVSIALRMTTLSRLTANVSSALAAFYTRGLAEKFPSVKAPSLELYACFWQDPSEHVRMAARSLFHCAASRAIPPMLCAKGETCEVLQEVPNLDNTTNDTTDAPFRFEQKIKKKSEKNFWQRSTCTSTTIIDWLESFEGQAWTSVIGGTSQDARAGRIIVASALSVWYPWLVKPELAPSVAPYLVKLVKAVVDRHSAVAAELLADGMENVWQHLISADIPSLISDVFLLIECLTAGGPNKPSLISNAATAMTIRETLTGNLLPSLAMANVASFLQIMQKQLAVSSIESPLHLISLMTIIRIVRAAPKTVVYSLSQVITIILHTMNMGKHCYQTALAAVREMVRVYPMVAIHQPSGKLAVGDVAGDVRSLAIHVYDLNSCSKSRILDASGPSVLLANHDGSSNTGGISALNFSEDGEGVVAFSQHGLIIRWWSLSSLWWEKLSRASTPVQCNKLVLVPPWSGFSPKSTGSSIMAKISNFPEINNVSEELKVQPYDDSPKRASSQTIDLSFRLEWRNGKVVLLHNGQELGVFQL